MVSSTAKQGVQITGFGFLLLFTIFWSGFTLVFDYFIAKSTIHQIQALGHATTIGTITSSEVRSENNGEGASHRPLIKYAYTVDNKPYEGNRYRYNQAGSNDRYARDIVAAYPVGKQVEVRHSPHDPADAVLLVGLEGIDLFAMMFLLPFNLIMLTVWLAGIDAGGSLWISPEAGGAKLINEGQYLRVRLSPMRPFYSAAAAAGGLAFILIFVFAFGFGVNAPLPLMLLAWGLILAAGVIAHVAAHRQMARGESDLLIDEFRETLTLPRVRGRREEVVIPARNIVAFEVEHAKRRDSDGDLRHRFVPTIVFTTNNGSQCREKLTEWHDETSAKSLTEWLQNRLHVKPIPQTTLHDDNNDPRS